MLSATTPFSLIIFGASGHLAKLKLYPALYVLTLKKRLPKDYAIVGFARTELTEGAFRALVEGSIRAAFAEVTEKALQEFLDHLRYCQGRYDDVKSFVTLREQLEAIEKGWKEPVRLAYLSIPPKLFPEVIHNLCKGHVHDPPKPFRCIVEKPVGSDIKSFEEVQKLLTSCFKQDEIYLLDHYLGKEAVRNVYFLRFANPLLERICKNTLIHHVEITASEPGGIEGRAGYFEHTGTFRDMFQSHLLQIVSLMTMRLGETEEALLHTRFDALQQFYIPPAASLDDVILCGQYSAGKIGGQAVAGYREEPDIEHDSRTNTFVALKLMSRTPRWQGVPFVLRSGKRLKKKETRISIQFQISHPVGEGSGPNRLDIILQGEAGMRIFLQTKIGGSEPSFRPLILSDPLVCVGDCLPEHGLLLLEAIRGKQTWFLTFDEVRTAWRLIDPLQTYLNHEKTTLHMYNAGTDGPATMKEWIAKDGMKWLE